jgi:GntR family transcriptional regulator
MILNRTSPVPLYYQLAESIRERVRSSELKPGDQLPSASTLSEQHRISRMTVLQAISSLVREGILVSIHGRGTFVAEPKLTHDALRLRGFTEELMQRGGNMTSQVLEQLVLPAPARVAIELELDSADLVVKIQRLRLSDATPMLLETIFLPARLCPGLELEDLATQSLYAVIKLRYQLRLVHAHQTLEATVANDFEGALFGIKPGTGMLLLEGVAQDEHNQPAEYYKGIYRGDRFKFSFASERSTGMQGVTISPHVDRFFP